MRWRQPRADWHIICAGLSAEYRGGKRTSVKSRTNILSVYGPVLLAAVLILTIAPTCLMPSCGGVSATPTVACDAPATSHFKSACELEAPVSHSSQPCHESGSGCDATMTHGTPQAASVASARVVPTDALISAAIEIPAATQCSLASAPVALANGYPPDPLGVRLTV